MHFNFYIDNNCYYDSIIPHRVLPKTQFKTILEHLAALCAPHSSSRACLPSFHHKCPLHSNFLLIQILPIFVVFWVLYAVGITGGSHRLWAHKSYSASLPLRIFLMLLNSGANQGSIYHWSRDHRLHHKFSDTDLDPHSMKKGFFFAHVGWLLMKKDPRLVEEGRKIDMSDLSKDAVVMWQKKYYPYISVFMCFLFPSNS